MSKVGVLGYGEVGKAVARFYKKPLIKDLGRDEFGGKLDVLHVCMPYFDKFAEVVKQNIKKHKPDLVIVHSTVPVGMTKKIGYKYAVHSPVRGVHPNLYGGIKTFVKYIGADNAAAGKRALAEYKKIGIKGRIVKGSKATELLKLLDTTYYGICIAYHAYAKKLCDKFGVDFETVMIDANRTYNEGYTKLGKANVVRPVLFPPPDKLIHGHCICQNADLLKKQFGSDLLLESILRHKDY